MNWWNNNNNNVFIETGQRERDGFLFSTFHGCTAMELKMYSLHHQYFATMQIDELRAGLGFIWRNTCSRRPNNTIPFLCISTHQSSLGRYVFSYSKQLDFPNNWEFLSSDHRWDHHCSHEQLLRSCSRRQHWGWGVVVLYPRTTGQVCNCMRETKSWA